MIALSLGFLAANANADQKTVAAIEKAGGTLTQDEINSLKDVKCEKSKKSTSIFDESKPVANCQAIVDEVTKLIQTYADNDQMIEAILRGSVEAHPEIAQQLSDAAILAAPNAVALIAGLMLEIAPTAAGPGNAPGLAGAIANPNNNIPIPSSGGGVSSPN